MTFTMGRLELTGIDGANPLGFLAAVGTLVTARAAGDSTVCLTWERKQRWVPVLTALSASNAASLCEMLAKELRGHVVPAGAVEKLDAAQKAMDRANEAIKSKRDEGNGRRRVDRPAKREAVRAERAEWLAALKSAVPRPELALGKKIDCTASEYREHAASFLEAASHVRRETVDLLAAFGTDAVLDNRSETVEPTPFCFITGSGHQYFLETVQKLVGKVESGRLQRTLFEPWTYRDPGLSMRWDPVEDKRYALMDVKPSAEGASTVWMANLLAYRGLTLFPCAPTRRGLGTTSWSILRDDRSARESGRTSSREFTWPIWEFAASPDTVRSVLQLQTLGEDVPDRGTLNARGIAQVFRASRIRVGSGVNYKVNFATAGRVG